MKVTEFRPHGTQVGHPPRCKCEPCAKARSWNTRLREIGYRIRRVDPQARTDINTIHEATGRSVTKTAEALNYDYNRVRNWLRRPDAPINVTAEESQHIHSVAVSSDAVDRVHYSRTKYLWRLNVLRAQGFDAATLQKLAGTRLELTMGAKGEHIGSVAAKKWFALDKIWHEIDGRLASTEMDGINPRVIVRMKTIAAERGFHPLAAYDNEYDLEPADTASARTEIAEDHRDLEEIVEKRVRVGLNRSEIREELHQLYPDIQDWNTIVGNAQKRIRYAARD